MLTTRGLGCASHLASAGLGPILLEVIGLSFSATDHVDLTDTLVLERQLTLTDPVGLLDALLRTTHRHVELTDAVSIFDTAAVLWKPPVYGAAIMVLIDTPSRCSLTLEDADDGRITVADQ